MNFFKKSKSPKDAKDPRWHTDLKHNSSLSNKKNAQQSFPFNKDNYDDKGNKINLGTKLGLSIEVEKISSEQLEILKKCSYENTALALMHILKRSNKTKFKQSILTPLVEYGFFEPTIPDKPRSPKQKYRLTGLFVQTKVENR